MLDKIKKFFIGLILAALALTSCTRAIPSNNSSLDKGSNSSSKGLFGFLFKTASTPTPPGDYVHTIEIKSEEIKEARTRSYNLHVPTSYDNSKAVGLLMLFPADGELANDFLKETKFQTFTDKEGYIVVLPDPYTEGMKWNNGVSKTSGPNDILFITTLLADLKDNFNIDANKVMVSGKAEGGIMAYQVAASLSDQIAAVGVYGATMGYRTENGAQPLKISNPSSPVSVIAVHGLMDNIIPAGNDKLAKEAAAGYMTFGETESFWKNAIGCQGSMKIKQSKNEHILKHTWSDCKNGTSFQSITIWTGTNVWPTGKTELKGYIVDIPATQIIWEFLVNSPKAAK